MTEIENRRWRDSLIYFHETVPFRMRYLQHLRAFVLRRREWLHVGAWSRLNLKINVANYIVCVLAGDVFRKFRERFVGYKAVYGRRRELSIEIN